MERNGLEQAAGAPIAALLLVVGLVGVSGPAASREQIPAETRKFAFDADIPQCADTGVVARIQSRFADREAEYWNSNLSIVKIDHVRTVAFRPNGVDLIPRRFCSARATLSDGRHRTVHYSILEDQGIASWQGTTGPLRLVFPTPASFGVEWCVVGLDRHFAFAPECRIALP
jgi:hypothetical protein